MLVWSPLPLALLRGEEETPPQASAACLPACLPVVSLKALAKRGRGDGGPGWLQGLTA